MTGGRSRSLRALACLAGLLVLAGCGARGETFLEQLTRFGIGAVRTAPVEVPPVPTRAQLNEIPFALVAVSRPSSEARGFAVAVAENDTYLVYQDAGRRSVVIEGGQIAATHGFAYDLNGVLHQPDDPVAAQVPVADWPKTLIRNYQFALQSAEDFEITVTCVVTPVARETIEIIELSFDVTRIEESCANTRRSFVNTYWADTKSGFIWKSQQWIGPRVEPMIVEIIRPVRPG